MNRRIRGAGMVVLAFGLVALSSAASASASGFEQVAFDEDSAECDFDGDGVYTNYQVVPGQTVLQLATSRTDGQSVTRTHLVTRFDMIEYYAAGANPETWFATGLSNIATQSDGDVLISGRITGAISATDTWGETIGRFVGVATIDADGELVPQVERGECRFGRD